MLPHQSIFVPIEAVGMDSKCKLCLLEPDNSEIVQLDRSFVTMQSDAGYYWYGSRRVGPIRPPKWVDRLMVTDKLTVNPDNDDDDESMMHKKMNKNQSHQLKPAILL